MQAVREHKLAHTVVINCRHENHIHHINYMTASRIKPELDLNVKGGIESCIRTCGTKGEKPAEFSSKNLLQCLLTDQANTL
jgi:hypothetical protein